MIQSCPVVGYMQLQGILEIWIERIENWKENQEYKPHTLLHPIRYSRHDFKPHVEMMRRGNGSSRSGIGYP
jgi:hypothetical protein